MTHGDNCLCVRCSQYHKGQIPRRTGKPPTRILVDDPYAFPATLEQAQRLRDMWMREHPAHQKYMCTLDELLGAPRVGPANHDPGDEDVRR